MISFRGKKILILAPHPDDEILGCGGLISRAKREGAKIYVLYFTAGTTKDFSEKGFSTKEERLQEIKKVAEFLKFDGWKIIFPGEDYHLSLDKLPQKTIINEIERGSKISLETIKPSMLLIPHPQDYNQDHRAVGLASVAATRPALRTYKNLQPFVLSYEYSSSHWNVSQNGSDKNFFVELTQKDVAKKLKALSLYKSQMKPHPHPHSLKSVKIFCELRGTQIGANLAEAFLATRITV